MYNKRKQSDPYVARKLTFFLSFADGVMKV